MSMEKSLDRPGEDDIGPYHEFVRVQSSRNPCLLNLDTFLSNPENNYDCQITVLDFHGGKQTPTARDHVLPGGLPAMLRKDNAEESGTLQGRILIIEDLTKELVELLGVELKIDPLFFAMHLHVSQKGQHPRQAPNDATLPSRLLTQDYINISFQRSVVNEKKRDSWSRYVRDTVISRKLVFLPSTNVGLIQHCVSILRVKLEDGFWIALVLVDPPIGNTYFSSDRKETKSKVEIKVEPYLGAYEDFTERPDSSSTTTSFTLRNNGMMKDLEMFWTQSPPVGFDAQNPTLHSLAHFPLRIVAAEWVKYVAVMNHCLIGHEYTKHDELGLDDFDTRLQELQSWRRRSMLSQQKVRAVLRQLQSWMTTNPHDTALLQPLITDYEYISGNIEEYGRMLESTVPVLTSVIQITQTRRAFTETTNITRLTILALVFVPLSYIASLFSMSESFAPGSHLFWVYFIVAVPVTMLVAIFARARGPQSWRMFDWLRRERRKHDIEAIPV